MANHLTTLNIPHTASELHFGNAFAVIKHAEKTGGHLLKLCGQWSHVKVFF